LETNGNLTTLVSFNNTNGANPWGRLTQGSDGDFYGTTGSGGSNAYTLNYGTVFRMTTNGVLSSLASFDWTNGSTPYAGLEVGVDGNFYGTTAYGGNNSLGSPGTVFKVTTNGALTSLASFDWTNGGNPVAGLTRGIDGNFYGTALQGGRNGLGTVFVLLLPFTIQNPLVTNGNFSFSFPAVAGRRYIIQQSTNLAGNWTVYTNFIGADSMFQLAVPISNGPAQFFRVVY
jgi:uncharacterized repeat protein (TIGR03803 family)